MIGNWKASWHWLSFLACFLCKWLCNVRSESAFNMKSLQLQHEAMLFWNKTSLRVLGQDSNGCSLRNKTERWCVFSYHWWMCQCISFLNYYSQMCCSIRIVLMKIIKSMLSRDQQVFSCSKIKTTLGQVLKNE